MFGNDLAIREIRPNHVIDYRRVPVENPAKVRWTDRVRWPGHLFGAWEEIFPRLIRGLPVPFQLDNVQRIDRPAGREAIREALVNLLVHTDYQEVDDAVINHLDDGYVFRNPGDSRVHIGGSGSELGKSERRNPTIADLFHHAGLADQAGSGFLRIFDEWGTLGFRRPRVETGAGDYTFALDLRLISLVGHQDRAWLTSLGEQFSEPEQLALLFVHHNGSIDNQTLRAAIGKNLLDTSRVLGRLKARGHLVIRGSGRRAFYEFGPKLPSGDGGHAPDSGAEAASSGTRAASSGGPIADAHAGLIEQVHARWAVLLSIADPLRTRERATRDVRGETIVRLCAEIPLSLQEIASLTARGPRIIREAVKELVEEKRLYYLYPDRPTHSRQRYSAHPSSHQRT
ncbi:MAG: ATP-binding protein [Thermomicrobiales bacterium]